VPGSYARWRAAARRHHPAGAVRLLGQWPRPAPASPAREGDSVESLAGRRRRHHGAACGRGGA